MTQKRQELLLGYLFGALDHSEEMDIEQNFKSDPEFQDQFLDLKESVSPVLDAYIEYEPPQDLVGKTCSYIWSQLDAEQEFENKHIPTPHIPLDLAIHLPEEAEFPSRSASSSIVYESQPTIIQKSRNFKKNIVASQRKKWRKRDLIASSLVGLLCAAVLFPAIRMSINFTRDTLYQQKVNQIIQNMPMLDDHHPRMSQDPYASVNVANYPVLMSQKSFNHSLLRTKFQSNISTDTMHVIFPWMTFNQAISPDHFQSISKSIPSYTFSGNSFLYSYPAVFEKNQSNNQISE